MKSNVEMGKSLSPDLRISSSKPNGYFRRKLLTPLVCSLFAGLGVFGGISALFAGLICVTIHLALWPDTVFDQVGTVLLIVAIPMILVGSVFLDEIKQIN